MRERIARAGQWLSMHRTGVLIVGAVVLAGGAFAVGMVVADDSDRVATLEEELEKTSNERDEAQDQLTAYSSELERLQDEVSSLEDRLSAERDLKGKGPKPESSGAGPQGDLSVGEATTVGELTLKLVSFNRVGGGSDSATYQATVTAKNNGSDDLAPFCAGGAALIDMAGRSYDPDSIISLSSDACEDLQPGLTADNIKFNFKVASDSKPAVLSLWGESDFEDSAKDWSVGG